MLYTRIPLFADRGRITSAMKQEQIKYTSAMRQNTDEYTSAMKQNAIFVVVL